MTPEEPEFTHVGADGAARMVDIGDKSVTARVARAQVFVRMRPETARKIRQHDVAKGEVLGVARVAGIMAAKKTAELIPLCHPLALDSVTVDFDFADDATLAVTAECRTHDRTGVEMEALTACSVAALTVYDMCKAVDRGIRIDGLRLIHKSGGKSGVYDAGDA